jgi:hypothetical protein
MTYPGQQPSLDGTNVSLHWLMQRPDLIQRRIQELSTDLFVSDQVFTGRQQVPGAIVYTTNEPIWTSRPPEIVSAGAEYPRAPAHEGIPALATIAKLGLDVPITDESLNRFGQQELDIQLGRIVNTLVDAVDTLAMIEMEAAIPTGNESAVGIPWENYDDAQPVADIALARARMRKQKLGYEPTAIVLDALAEGHLMSCRSVQGSLAGINVQVATQANGRLTILGMPVWPTVNLTGEATGKCYLIDTVAFGGLAYERLGSPEYAGDPASGIETWTRRDPDANDQYLVRGRRPVVAYVNGPMAAWVLTGVQTPVASTAVVPPSRSLPHEPRVLGDTLPPVPAEKSRKSSS